MKKPETDKKARRPKNLIERLDDAQARLNLGGTTPEGLAEVVRLQGEVIARLLEYAVARRGSNNHELKQVLLGDDTSCSDVLFREIEFKREDLGQTELPEGGFLVLNAAQRTNEGMSAWVPTEAAALRLFHAITPSDFERAKTGRKEVIRKTRGDDFVVVVRR